MKLLHLVFTRFNDNETKTLPPEILDKLQRAFLLFKQLQIELLGRVIIKGSDAVFIYERTPSGHENGWSIEIINDLIVGIRESKQGQCDGEERRWHPNGRIFLLRNWRDSRPNGEEIWWASNGQIHSRTFYKNGYENGECTCCVVGDGYSIVQKSRNVVRQNVPIDERIHWRGHWCNGIEMVRRNH